MVVARVVVRVIKTLKEARARRKKRKMAADKIRKRAKMLTQMMTVSNYFHPKAQKMATMKTRMTCKPSMRDLNKKCLLKKKALPPLNRANRDIKGLLRVMICL